MKQLDRLTNTMFRRVSLLALLVLAAFLLVMPASASGSTPGSLSAKAAAAARSIPLRVMVPHPKLGPINMASRFPKLDPRRGSLSMAPGPRMNLQATSQIGPFKILAVLVQFSDHTSTVSASFFDSLIFGPTGDTVRAYYKDVSYTQLDIVTVNMPSSIGWLTAPQPYAYYVNGQYCLDGVYPNNCQKLVEDMAYAVDSVVNFANYDNNGDGLVDTLIIAHAGPGAEFTSNPNDVWSHSWTTYNAPYLDGKYIVSYTIEPEYWVIPGDMTRGVYDHELGHAFGLPDLYDVDDSSSGIGNWSLMSFGTWNGPDYMGAQPAQLDAWSRLYLGFTTATNATSLSQIVSLPAVEQNVTGSIYRLDTGFTGEYFLLENRQAFLSDAYLPSNGLLIWHVDDNLFGNIYECKDLSNWNCSLHFNVALEQADGALNLEFRQNRGDSGDPYPGTANNRAFTFSSNPNTSSYYFSTKPAVNVRSISDSGSTMTVRLDGPLAAPTLLAPTNGGLTSNNTPVFSWAAVNGAESYQIQIDNDSDFSSPVQDTVVTGPTYTASLLTDGTAYFWHVSALRASTGDTGPWSATRTVQIDQVRLSTPALSAPVNGGNLATLTPAFSWTLVTNATQYQWQVDDDSTFVSPLVTRSPGRVTSYVAMAADGLQYGMTYYWRVRAGDVYGSWSDWSLIRSFTLTILKSPANGAYSITNRPAFTWAAVSGATYTLQVAKDAGFTAPLAATYTGTAIAYTVPTTAPLDYGQYWWRIHLTTTTGIDAWMQPWTLTVTTPIPAAPGPLTPTVGQVLNDNTPDFTWNPTLTTAGAPFDYQIQIARTSNFLTPTQDARRSGPDSLMYTATTLADGLYYWRVRAINNSDTAGLWSAPRSFTVDTIVPPAPKLVSPRDWSAISLTRPQFIWAAVTGAKQYILELYSGSDCSTLVWTTAALTTNFYTSAQTLTAGPYCWHVMARDAATNSGAYSAFFHLTVSLTPITLPAAPLLLTPGNNVPLAALSSFTWSSAPVSQFQIQIDSTSAFTSPKQDALTTALSYTAGPLADGLYYWRVRAINNGVAGAWSIAWKFTLASTAPAAPVLLAPVQAANLTVTRPTLTWQAVTGAKSYLVQLGPDSSFNTGVVVNRTVITTSCALTTAEALSYGSTYFWRVQALNIAGVGGGWSPVFQFTVTVHRAPVNLASITTIRPAFAWQAVTGATYGLQVSTDSTFTTKQIDISTGTLAAYTIPTNVPGLSAGLYYWRVRVITLTLDAWMPAWSFRVTPALPGVTLLSAPTNNTLTRDNTPTFVWKVATNGQTYQIQIDDLSTFASPNQDVTGGPGVLLYTADMLPNGKYYWHVRAITSDGGRGAWSAVWAVTIDALVPDVPVPTGPADGASITNPQLTLRWNAAAGAATYQVRLGTTNPPAMPPIPVGAVLSYKVAMSLSSGVYYWQVRAVDAAGNMSAWSTVSSVRVVAGYTAPNQTTPTVTQTATPQATGTPEATITPTATPETLQMVEAEQDIVTRAGTWTVQGSSAASGGQYLFSSGNPGDALTLGFSGTTVAVIFVEHPALGTFAVEVDGQVVQTVVTTNAATVFGARTVVNTLNPGTHVVRVYAVEGTVAIDAFAVEAVVILPPTGTTSPVATQTPSVTPTPQPATPTAQQPTETPTFTPSPTAAPPLVTRTLPFSDTFDTGPAWTAEGSWTPDTRTARSGASWFASSAARGQGGTLTAPYVVDLRATGRPVLTLWQKMSLSADDIVVLDFSLDNGTTWQPLDTQVGAVSNWSQRTLDLSAYRGQMLRLRFRLDTPGPALGELTTGYWLDDLAVVDGASATATPTPLPETTPVPSATPTGAPTDTPTAVEPTATRFPIATPTATPAGAIPTVIQLPTQLPPVMLPTAMPVWTNAPLQSP